MPKKIRLITHEQKLLGSHPADTFFLWYNSQTAKENPPVSASSEILWLEKRQR
jgi:hypothetical protein